MFKVIILVIFLLYTILVIVKFRGTKSVAINVISGFFLAAFGLGIFSDLKEAYKVTREPQLTYAKIVGKYESDDDDGYMIEYSGIENKYETNKKYKMNDQIFIQFSQKRPEKFIKLKEKVESPLSFQEIVALHKNGYKRMAIISSMLIIGLAFVNVSRKSTKSANC
jgi:uncharacterized membrane protein